MEKFKGVSTAGWCGAALLLGASLSIFLSSAIPGVIRNVLAAPLYLFGSPAELDVKFAAGVSGAKALGRIKVPVADGYTFYLRLHAKEGSEQDRIRVEALAGEIQVGSDGKIINNPPLAVPIRLKVTKVGSEQTQPSFVLDKIFREEKIQSLGETDYLTTVTGLALDAETYDVEVESLADIPALIGTPIFLHVGTRRR